MTSTSFNVGLTDNTRLSSRVLRPPGGGHTDIFGGEPEPLHTGRRPAAACTGVASVVAQEDPKPANGPAASPVSNQSPQNGQTTPTEPAAAPIPGPEPKESAAKPEPAVAQTAKAEPPKRVRVPPGGFSSGLW